MVKRMPYNFSFNKFLILATFLLCGAVLGAFSGSFVPEFSISQGLLTNNYNNFINSLITVVKYNLIIILATRFFGFFIPALVFARGFILSFVISSMYYNAENIFENSIILQSFLINLVDIPCFLLISVLCIDTFANKLHKRRKVKYNSDKIIGAILALDFIWILCVNGLF